MTDSTEKSEAVPFREGIYTHQFANYANQLETQHIIYRESILDWEKHLEKQSQDLQADKDVMESSGVNSPTKWRNIESGLENISLQRSVFNARKEELRVKIEPLLRSLIEFWPDILQSFEWGHISQRQFAAYLRKFRGILHEGGATGLCCYSGPAVNKIADYLIENYKLM